MKATGLQEAFVTGHTRYDGAMVRIHSLPNSNPKQAGERLDYVALTEGEEYHYVKPTGKHIMGFRGWVKMDRAS